MNTDIQTNKHKVWSTKLGPHDGRERERERESADRQTD